MKKIKFDVDEKSGSIVKLQASELHLVQATIF